MQAQRTTMLRGCLTIKEVMPLAQRIARQCARRRDEQEDLVQVALFAYHRAIASPKDADKVDADVTNPKAFACRVLRCAMLNYYTPTAQFHSEHEDVDDFSLPSRDNQLDLLEQDDFMDALERSCGKTARAVVENLVAPSGACSQAILANVQKKLKRCGEMKGADPRCRPRGVVGSIRISQESVRRAMGLTPREWSVCLASVRTFASQWFGRPTATPS
jgi:hypothetical protein